MYTRNQPLRPDRPPHGGAPAATSLPETEDVIRSILERYRTLAIVGLSSKPSRPSYGVAAYLKTHGYHVIPVNPNEVTVLGERAYARLEDIPERIEVVVIFRRSEYVPGIVDEAIRLGARVIWMQEGVAHEEAASRARQAGLLVIQDRCMLKEHARRFVAEGI
jgi:predicted CoA-binding protein